jgi:hypothetical protein
MATETSTPDDHKIRVISIYATRWQSSGDPDPNQPHLSLGRLEEFYSLFQDQLPHVIASATFTADSVKFVPTTDEVEELAEGTSVFTPSEAGVEIVHAESRLFLLPSDQVVATLDFEVLSQPVDIDPDPVIALLERCAYARVLIDGADLETHISALAEAAGAEPVEANTALPPERHQIVFSAHVQERELPGDEMIKRILYRVDPPNRPEFMEYKRPSGLNQDKTTLCAVTPNVSFLYGHPPYVENSVFLTVVQAVGTAARFRQIWRKAYRQVRAFRRDGQDEGVGTQQREGLEFLADELGNLVLDLSFSVETSADLGLLIPSIRIESFHKELYAAMELRERAETVSRMFSRLDASIRSELTAIEIRDRQRQEEKQLRWGFAFSVLSFIGIPIGFLGAYFGINASQVDPGLSIFDWGRYWIAYVVAGVLALIPILCFLFLNWRALRTTQRQRAERLRRLEEEARDNAVKEAV